MSAGVKPRHGLVQVPGGRVFYERMGGGPGFPLLCLHGGPGMPHDYLDSLAELATYPPGREVIFYDQLGCGRSDRPDEVRLWTVDRFVEELAAVRQALDINQAHLLGSSWGGMLALQYTLDRDPPPASLVLAGGPASARAFYEHCNLLRAQMPAEVREVLNRHEASGYFDCPEFVGAVAQFYRRHLCRLDPWPDGLERTFAGLGTAVYQTMWGPSEFGPVTGVLRDWDVTARLGEISAPTLLTVGRFDECPLRHMEEVAEAISDARLVIFEDSSHTPFYEERDSYLRVVASFLAEHD